MYFLNLWVKGLSHTHWDPLGAEAKFPAPPPFHIGQFFSVWAVFSPNCWLNNLPNIFYLCKQEQGNGLLAILYYIISSLITCLFIMLTTWVKCLFFGGGGGGGIPFLNGQTNWHCQSLSVYVISQNLDAFAEKETVFFQSAESMLELEQ